MRIGSLFSGAGGLDMAAEQVFSGHTVWQCEVDKAASKVLAYRWGWRDVPNLGDITAVDWYEVPEIDVLCGGFPCQDVSSAGKRAGIKDGTRSGLWAVFADIIDIIRPPFVVIENVRGLLSAEAHRDVEPGEGTVGNESGRPVLRAAGAVFGDLADIGYDAAWTTLAAGDVGAPHRRERVFIVAQSSSAAVGFNTGGTPGAEAGAHSGDRSGDHRGERADVALLPTPTRSDGTGGGIRTGLSWEGTTQSTGDGGNSRLRDVVGLLLPTPRSSDCFGAGLHGDGGMDLRTTVTLLPTPSAVDGHPSSPGRHNSKGHQTTLPGTAREIANHELLCTPSASDGAGGKTSRSGGRIDEPLLGGQAREMETSWGKYEPAIRRWESLTRIAPAPTEPNKNGNPRLSAAFSEWLMGWPAGWVTDPAIGISRNDQLRIVGNGVCPQQAAAALRQLLAVG